MASAAATNDDATKQLRATIEATVRSCLSAHRDGAISRDASTVSRGLAASCTRAIVPGSFARSLGLQPADLAAMPNDAYVGQFAKDLEVSAVTRTDVLDLTIDLGLGGGPDSYPRVAARTDNTATTSDGQEFTLEFAWFFDLSRDGREVTRVVEFVDPVEAGRFQERVEALYAEKQKEKEKA
ncbi:hypothetical protein SLS62_004813 [Diatrype stigma]|uniref:Uncharacterized protein n=1 Tax=Diatrype stigma TaxID=117547 RepID=A0AAN9UQ93_9PEZI